MYSKMLRLVVGAVSVALRCGALTMLRLRKRHLRDTIYMAQLFVRRKRKNEAYLAEKRSKLSIPTLTNALCGPLISPYISAHSLDSSMVFERAAFVWVLDPKEHGNFFHVFCQVGQDRSIFATMRATAAAPYGVPFRVMWPAAAS